MNYVQKLREGAQKVGNIACIGLDPVLSHMPFETKDPPSRLRSFFAEFFAVLANASAAPAAFKINIGYWTVLNQPAEGRYDGDRVLFDVIHLIRKNFPHSQLIFDGKRGDIARSSWNYAQEAFELYGADAATGSPYMGSDSVHSLESEKKGLYLILRTSNPAATFVQSQELASGDMLWQKLAEFFLSWRSFRGSLGAVMGASYKEDLAWAFRFFASEDFPLLIPGVGAQGASPEDVLSVLRQTVYPPELVRINSSSGITHPWKSNQAPTLWRESCHNAIENFLRECEL